MHRLGRGAAGIWLALLFVADAGSAGAQSLQDLQQMSIDQLQNLDVSSVTKTSQALSAAPASIYVITHDQIARSGAASVPEILRLAPNLQVIQLSASHYIITARGFSGNTSPDQNFSNKLLVLIDGRSVYTPLFSGVYWDMQDVVPEDIERIEVISGPGATLWGANAVNGVINIITRKAAQTQGGLLDITAGNLEQSVSLRYGGTLGDDLAYRLYVRDYNGEDTQTPGGAKADDHWSKPQGGFHLDWTPSAIDTFTFQGDAYSGTEAQMGAPNEDIDGGDLVARWNRTWGDGSSLQVQAYIDRMERSTRDNGGDFWVDTYDLDVQHSFNLNPANQITWGGGLRASDYRIDGTATLFFAPPHRTLDLSNLFAQDSITIDPALTAILGVKLEDDPFSGLAALPSARLSWKLSDHVLLWTAISRAIRSPTPFDDDVVEKSGGATFLTGSPDFESEKLTAYELGTRMQPTEDLSFSVSTFYNVYDDLRSIELTPVTVLPLVWGNKLHGNSYGVEAWGDYQLTAWWRLSASFEELNEHFNFTPGSSMLLGTAQLGDDPQQRASLHSAMNLGAEITFDADLRYVSELPNPSVPAYVELNTSVGWKVSDGLRLSLSGFNLLHPRHQEFPASEANAVPRSFAIELQQRF
jgi:iron complex outermembrane receptor protein